MTALGRSAALQNGSIERMQKPCIVQARPVRVGRQPAKGRVQALAAPSRQRHISPERVDLEHSLAASHFGQGPETSVDAIRQRSGGKRGLQAATDTVSIFYYYSCGDLVCDAVSMK